MQILELHIVEIFKMRNVIETCRQSDRKERNYQLESF